MTKTVTIEVLHPDKHTVMRRYVSRAPRGPLGQRAGWTDEGVERILSDFVEQFEIANSGNPGFAHLEYHIIPMGHGRFRLVNKPESATHDQG